MLKMKKMLMFLLLLGGGLSGYSREHLDTASLAIYYRQGRSSFDAVYRNNGTRLDAFMERFRRLQGDTLCSLRYVHVVGGSSPEGGRAVNERLARLRARQMERRLESDIPLADSLVEYSSSGPPAFFAASRPSMYCGTRPNVPCWAGNPSTAANAS